MLAIDLGAVRVGLALSDSERILASAHAIIEVANQAQLLDAIAKKVEELGVSEVLVGLPLSLSGAAGPAALGAKDFVQALRHRLSVPVGTYDERLSSIEVTRRRRLLPSDARNRRRPRAKATTAKRAIDDEAAAVFLQAFLDANRVL